MLDGGGGVSRVTGPHMQRLQQYLLASDPDQVSARIDSWNLTATLLEDIAQQFESMSRRSADAFSESSLTAASASRAFTDASVQMRDKAEQLRAATKALSVVQERYSTAKTKYEALMASLPSSHGPAPSADDPKYAKGPGRSEAEGKDALAADRAAHAAEAQAIADAEREAAQQCAQVDDGNQQADPPVRAITEEPYTPPAGVSDSGGSAGSTPTYSSTGSRSAVQAAQAKHDSANSGTLYADGWGHEIKAEQQAIIDQEMAKNDPEWDDAQGQWVNADGSPAEATSYASVETAEGLAPLSGGIGGAAALGVGLGGAGLAAGAMAALKAKFAAGTAAAAGQATTAKSAAGARAGASGARSTAGAGQRSGAGGAGSRDGSRTGGAGSRAGRGGAGGAGGRGGKKDKKGKGSEYDNVANYEEDWTERASNVLDPESARGWVPSASRDGDEQGEPTK